MPRSKSMTAMEGKVSLGHLYLSDLKGAKEVFSVENRNSAYAADRRKVVKKGTHLSRSFHDDPISAPGSIDLSQYQAKPKIRSGGRRPPRSKSFDGSTVPEGLAVTAERGSRRAESNLPKPTGTNVKDLCKAFSKNTETNNTNTFRSSSTKGSGRVGTVKGMDKSTSSNKTSSTSSFSSSSSDETD